MLAPRLAPRLFLAALAFAAAALPLGACSSTTTTPPAEGGAPPIEAGAQPDAPSGGLATQTGRAIVVQLATPLAGATVSAAGKQATTEADGTYTLQVPRGTPFTLRFTAPEHYQLIEQEYVVTKDPYARGDSLVLAKATAQLLSAFLDGYDKTRGLIAVRVVKKTGCATETGAVVGVEAPADAKPIVKYTTNGLPGNGTSIVAGDNNGALIYNVPTGAPLKVTVKHPTCAPLPFPVEFEGTTYTSGAATPEPGESLSFVRVFLGPGAPQPDAGVDAAPPADAGTDAAPTDAGADAPP